MNGLTEECLTLVGNVIFETVVKLVNSLYLVVVATLKDGCSLLIDMKVSEFLLLFSSQIIQFQLKEDWDLCQTSFSLGRQARQIAAQ